MQRIRLTGSFLILAIALIACPVAAASERDNPPVMQQFLKALKLSIQAAPAHADKHWASFNRQRSQPLQFRREVGTLVDRGAFRVELGSEGLQFTQRF